uniref:Helicase ATP-binding domain-containing protein n=1 Tax=viral metagenome TaxID=1070528 RepID=A0A6C0H914_9ZZZZ
MTNKINFTNMNIKDFIDCIITFDNVDDILENSKTQSEKGFIFERLFDIIIKFGFCDIFINSNFYHMIGNSNNAKLKILENLNQYLNEKVISSNSSGCSDITLQNKNDNTFIFISSKYPKSNEAIKKHKSVDYYDIQNIIAMATENKHIYKNYKIYLVVPNKKNVLDKVKNANESSYYITNHITEDNILDKEDLNKYFLVFKQDIIKNKNNNWQSIYLNSKENLKLRFHQELITQKTSTLIEEGNKSFLWGCKCRSGKTYMFGGIIIKQFNIKKKLNVLIITPAPTETAPQFTNDLFNKFKDFDKFKVHHIEGSKMLDSIEISDNNIFIMSKQLLQKYVNNKTIIKIKNLKLDIIGFDENHFSGTTDLSKDILTSYSSKYTVKIYLTATYNKPLKEWNILPECQMFWDIEDEQICKSILIDENNLDKLKEKHGNEYITKTIKYYTDLGLSINNIFNCYKKMPDLHLITNLFDQQRYEIIKEKLNKENKMGFCFDTLLGLNKAKTKFSFENEVKTILRYISGSHKNEDGEKTLFTRINNICSEKETRVPFTQIWFLPSDNINEISECLKKLMIEDNILKNYDVLCINRKNKELVKDIKDEINKKEIEASSKGKLGLILLAGNMLTLGITLNLCDLVILMNNTLSSDKVLQQMYRCMTESENKKIGFVIDLNISRVLNTCINYTVYKNEKSIDDKIKYLINNHLINIDIDMILNKKINSDIIIKKLMEIWKEDPINSFRTLLRKLDNYYEEFDNSTQQLINKTFTKSIKYDNVSLKLKFKDDEDEIQNLPTGKEKVKNDSDNESSYESSDNESLDKKEKEEQEETQISFTKDVLHYVIPLTCILTIKNSNMDFVKMLNDIKENPELLDTFDDQCLIWWNKKDLIDLIKDIINRYFDKNSNNDYLPHNISVQFKMSLQSLIDNPKELLELITECLKPKDIEKKQFGEVFTPMNLVNEMLDKLPIEVWKNKNLKWLDPCCGMGNFPIAVYLRLIEELKDEIKDVKERKKHILENMLYMCELNKKNILICKQIFDINNEYKLNIYEGDSLKVDYNKEFNIKQFNIIIGNPPYQDNSGNKGKGHTLWTRFVELSLCKLLCPNGYLVFVHPSLWRQPDHDMLKLMKTKQILYLEIHDEKDGHKTFKCSTRYDWYVLQNTNYIKDTEIKGQDAKIYNIDLINWNFIPNYDFYNIGKLIDSDDKANIIASRSAYGHDKKWVNKIKDDKYKYPVVYSVNRQNKLTLHYSSTNENGHFGLPKVIFGSGATGFFIDEKGEYGMTQWCVGVVDKKENLQKIKNTFESDKFKEIIKAISVSKAEINSKILKYFKKDFYTLFSSNNKVNKIIEPEIIVKDKNNEDVNIIVNNDEILTVSKKKILKKNIINDNVIDNIINAVSKNKN